LRIVVISDTHERHEDFGDLEGEVLVHCGDMFDLFAERPMTLQAMDDWFGRQRQRFDVILTTGGNHDHQIADALIHHAQPFANAVFLQEESFHYGGKHFWGAPWVPDLPSHAFHQSRRQLERLWGRIPSDVEVLITHTPPWSVLDETSAGYRCGCNALLEEVQRVAPALHLFGHIHCSRGEHTAGATRFVNASSVARGGRGVLAPMILDL
jgi:Icc-related predicted phosphoesterase